MESLTPHERYANFTPNEMHDYRESQKEMWDMYAITTTAEAKGVRKGIEMGRAEGRAEGEKNKALAIAKNLLAIGMTTDQVAEATGLAPDDIEKLK